MLLSLNFLSFYFLIKFSYSFHSNLVSMNFFIFIIPVLIVNGKRFRLKKKSVSGLCMYPAFNKLICENENRKEAKFSPKNFEI